MYTSHYPGVVSSVLNDPSTCLLIFNDVIHIGVIRTQYTLQRVHNERWHAAAVRSHPPPLRSWPPPPPATHSAPRPFCISFSIPLVSLLPHDSSCPPVLSSLRALLSSLLAHLLPSHLVSSYSHPNSCRTSFSLHISLLFMPPFIHPFAPLLCSHSYGCPPPSSSPPHLFVCHEREDISDTFAE